MFHRALVFVLIMLVGATSSCGVFESACDRTIPLVQQAQIYGDDASASLEAAQIMFEAMELSGSEWKQVEWSMTVAWTALRSAQSALLSAQSTCSSVDVMTIFKNFIAAWQVLDELLATHSKRLTGRVLTSSFAPMIVQRARP